jgi:hypothetical protein
VLEAGVLIVSENESVLGPKSVFTSKAYVDKDRMRIEMGDQDTDQVVIFRQDKERFWIINNKDKTYHEMTKQDVQKIEAQMDSAMAMMQEQMKNLPPEQRKMMEQMMQGKMSATVPEEPKIAYKKVASGEKINRWTCDKYEGSAKGDREEIWTTDWRQAGLTESDFKVMQSAGEFFAGLPQQQPFMYKVGSKEWEKEHGYPGLPIRTIRYSGAQVQHRTEIKEIRRQDFAVSLFELPGGLQKKEMP